jgi:hypothetical protein
MAQGFMGAGIAWYGPAVFGSERDAKRMYKYHRYVSTSLEMWTKDQLLIGRLSGYMLLLLILATAHIAGVYSMWAQRMTGFHKVLRVIAYWIGIPMIAVGVLMRIR